MDTPVYHSIGRLRLCRRVTPSSPVASLPSLVRDSAETVGECSGILKILLDTPIYKYKYLCIGICIGSSSSSICTSRVHLVTPHLCPPYNGVSMFQRLYEGVCNGDIDAYSYGVDRFVTLYSNI